MLRNILEVSARALKNNNSVGLRDYRGNPKTRLK